MDLQKTAEWLKTMPPETLKKMKDTFTEFNRLKIICVGKKYVVIAKNMAEIQVLKMTPEVKEMQNILLSLNMTGIKYTDQNGKILLDKPIDKPRRKRKT